MPEGIITGAQNPYAIATIVSARALAPLKANTVAWAIANMDYSAELASFGDRVNVPIPAEFSSSLLADGGTVTRQNPTLGNATLILNRHRESTFEHTDVNKALATPNLEQTSLGQAVANFAEDMDEDLLGVYANYSTNVGAYNTSLTEATIDAAETALFTARVSAASRLYCVVTGTGYSALRSIPRFSENDKRGTGDAAAQKLQGNIKGFTVMRAQKVNVTSSTNRHGIALAPTALLGAVRRLGSEQPGMGAVQVEMQEDGVSLRLTMSYDGNILGRMTTIDTLYGFVPGRATHGVEVRH